MLNLEGLWRLQEAGLLTMELYVMKYVYYIEQEHPSYFFMLLFELEFKGSKLYPCIC